MKSRIEILDECATKYSRMYDGINVDTFEDYVNCYPADMVLKMVYSAMAEYNKPINNGALDIVSNCCPKCKTINITENEGVIWCYECEKAYDC